MPRLTRAESQAHTRDRLIATATELFLRDGYSATSLDRVADTAGYSKGAVYSNFRNKDELCLAVLDGIRARNAAAIAESLAAAEGVEDLLNAFASWWERTIADETWAVLETEYLAHARRDPQLRRELASRNAALHRAMTTLVTTYVDRYGIELPIPVETAGTAMLGMAIGLGLLRSVDNGFDFGALPAMIRVLVNAGRPDETPPPVNGRPAP